jgi:hypothetical protein
MSSIACDGIIKNSDLEKVIEARTNAWFIAKRM